MLKRLIILICLIYSITACKNENNKQEHSNTEEKEQTLLTNYKMAEVFQYKEHEDDTNKILLSIDERYAYFVFYEDQISYRCLSIVREDIQSHEQTVLYDFSKDNYTVNWLAVEDSVVYISYNDLNEVNSSYSVAKLDDEFTVIDSDILEISNFYKTDSNIYYIAHTDHDIEVKCIQDGNLILCEEINQADGIFPADLGGTISNNKFIYSYNNDVYLFDSEIETYHFDYTVLNACMIDKIIVTNEYYIENDQAKYRTHFFNTETQKDIEVTDTQLKEIYSDEYDCLFYCSNAIKVLEVDENNNIISAQMNEFEANTKWTHFENRYYQSCKDYNEYTIYSILHN